MKSAMFIAILAALQAKYKSLGLSVKALEAVAGHLESTVTEEAGIEAAVAGAEPFLKIAQSEADAAREAAKKKPDEKKQDAPANEPAKTELPDDTPPWAKTMVETNQKLVARIDALEQGKTVESRKTQLEAKLKDAPEAFKTATLKAFGRMTFADDADFDSYLGETETEVATQIQSAADAGLNNLGQPRKAGGGGGNAKQATPEEAAAIIKNMS